MNGIANFSIDEIRPITDLMRKTGDILEKANNEGKVLLMKNSVPGWVLVSVELWNKVVELVRFAEDAELAEMVEKRRKEDRLLTGKEALQHLLQGNETLHRSVE